MSERNSTIAFTRRLADIMTLAEDEPELYVELGTRHEANESGRIVSFEDGGECIVILRGGEQGRERALKRMLARLDTR